MMSYCIYFFILNCIDSLSQLDISFPNRPTTGLNTLTIQTSSDYALNRITSVKFNKISYFGESEDKIYTNDGNEHFTYDINTKTISLNINYYNGDKIELIEIEDDSGITTYPSGTFVFKNENNINIILEAIASETTSTEYKVHIKTSEWNTYDINKISKLIFSVSDGTTIEYCVNCANNISITSNSAEFSITPTSSALLYSLLQIESIDSSNDIIYDEAILNYPQILITKDYSLNMKFNSVW